MPIFTRAPPALRSLGIWVGDRKWWECMFLFMFAQGDHVIRSMLNLTQSRSVRPGRPPFLTSTMRHRYNIDGHISVWALRIVGFFIIFRHPLRVKSRDQGKRRLSDLPSSVERASFWTWALPLRWKIHGTVSLKTELLRYVITHRDKPCIKKKFSVPRWKWI